MYSIEIQSVNEKKARALAEALNKTLSGFIVKASGLYFTYINGEEQDDFVYVIVEIVEFDSEILEAIEATTKDKFSKVRIEVKPSPLRTRSFSS
ncbi:MAG: hypothetical protein KJI71_02375 [Patescibacteria group bacterium]|nr:hypothetical protein [Patescibacteria group bacterium]